MDKIRKSFNEKKRAQKDPCGKKEKRALGLLLRK